MNLLKRIAPLTRIAILILSLPTFLYIYFAMLANFDLSSGRFALFMDEQITFDGIRNILHPKSFFLLCYSVIDGGDQRYGRILWNVSAVASYIPERVFGEAGQIIATRTVSLVFLLGAFILLARTFSSSKFGFFAILLANLALPYTAYFTTMPKPEPMQLFTLALIAFLVIRKKEIYARKTFLIIGICFGIKISSIVFLLLILILLYRNTPASLKTEKNWIFQRATFFFVGLVIAVPTLLLIALIFVASVKFWDIYLRNRTRNYLYLLITMGLAGLLSVVTNLALAIAINRNFLLNYLNYTILGTAHGSDSKSVNLPTWIKYLLNDWSGSPPVLMALFLLVAMTAIALIMRHSDVVSKKEERLIFLFAGALANLVVMLTTERLWGFYLFTGAAIFISAFIGLLEKFKFLLFNSNVGKIIVLSLSIFLPILISMGLNKNLDNLQTQSKRSNSDSYFLQLKSYNEIRTAIEQEALKREGVLRVALDPNYFQLESSETSVIERFWGPFSGWENYDLVVLKPFHLGSAPNSAVGTLEETARYVEIADYNKYVVSNASECKLDTCLEILSTLPDGGQILSRIRKP